MSIHLKITLPLLKTSRKLWTWGVALWISQGVTQFLQLGLFHWAFNHLNWCLNFAAVTNAFQLPSVTYQCLNSLKEGLGSLLTPVLTLFDGLTRMEGVIVPLDLARSLGSICAHYLCRVFYHTITYIYIWFQSTRKGNSHLTKLLGWMSSKKIWRNNNSPPYVTARCPPQQIPPLNFLCYNPSLYFHL